MLCQVNDVTYVVCCYNRLYYYTAVSDAMAVLNASVNFIIYTITSPKFRRGLVTSCQQNTGHVIDQYALRAGGGVTGVGGETVDNIRGGGPSMGEIQRIQRNELVLPMMLCAETSTPNIAPN